MCVCVCVRVCVCVCLCVACACVCVYTRVSVRVFTCYMFARKIVCAYISFNIRNIPHIPHYISSSLAPARVLGAVALDATSHRPPAQSSPLRLDSQPRTPYLSPHSPPPTPPPALTLRQPSAHCAKCDWYSLWGRHDVYDCVRPHVAAMELWLRLCGRRAVPRRHRHPGRGRR